MAVRKGKHQAVQPQAGRVIPAFHAQAPALKSAMFLAEGASSRQRTLIREAEVVARVLATIDSNSDAQAIVINHFSQDPDTRQWIVRPIFTNTDLALEILCLVDLNADTQQAVTALIEELADTWLDIIHPVALDADAHLTIFVALIRETHLIKT